MDNTPFRPGISSSEYPPITQLLLRKSPKPFNILIGEDIHQIRFAEKTLGLKHHIVEKVTDADLLTGEPCLLCITTSRVVDISESVRDKTSFWSIGPIRKGSAAASAIVKHAATALGGKMPDKDALQRIADTLASEGVGDIHIAIWKAVWLLLGPPLEEPKRWVDPWENYTGWLRPDIDPMYRLNSLFKDLSAYTFIMSGEVESLKKAGLSMSPSKVKYLSSLKLHVNKVYETLRELSSWRMKNGDPYLSAMRIAGTWSGS
jgi:hypothetical protein